MNNLGDDYKNATDWYYRQIYAKSSFTYDELNFEKRFPRLFENLQTMALIVLNSHFGCNCECCIEANTLTNSHILDLENEIKQNNVSLEKKRRIKNEIRVLHRRNKNKIYECNIRTQMIIDYVVKFALNKMNTDKINTNTLMLVPFQSIEKIKQIMISKSDERIKKIGTSIQYKLDICNGLGTIYLVSLEHFMEGFCIGMHDVHLLMLNCFYSHMYLNNMHLKILYYMMLKIRPFAKICIIANELNTYLDESEWIRNFCSSMKICL